MPKPKKPKEETVARTVRIPLSLCTEMDAALIKNGDQYSSQNHFIVSAIREKLSKPKTA